MVLAPVHEVGVEPERHVVQEHARVDSADVDQALTARAERGQRADRLAAIDSAAPGASVPERGFTINRPSERSK